MDDIWDWQPWFEDYRLKAFLVPSQEDAAMTHFLLDECIAASVREIEAPMAQHIQWQESLDIVFALRQF